MKRVIRLRLEIDSDFMEPADFDAWAGAGMDAIVRQWLLHPDNLNELEFTPRGHEEPYWQFGPEARLILERTHIDDYEPDPIGLFVKIVDP